VGYSRRYIPARPDLSEVSNLEAQGQAAEDKQGRDEVELRNQAEQLTYQAERTITDLGDKVSSEDKAEVERQVSTLREALKGSDIGAVRSGMDALTGTLSRVATAAYQAAPPMDGHGQPGPPMTSCEIETSAVTP